MYSIVQSTDNLRQSTRATPALLWLYTLWEGTQSPRTQPLRPVTAGLQIAVLHYKAFARQHVFLQPGMCQLAAFTYTHLVVLGDQHVSGRPKCILCQVDDLPVTPDVCLSMHPQRSENPLLHSSTCPIASSLQTNTQTTNWKWEFNHVLRFWLARPLSLSTKQGRGTC